MSPPPEPPDEPVVRIGNRYRLDEGIGAGAMGAVWRATDELLNRTVAVKELLVAAAPPTAAGLDALEESRQRILREGRIGARLRHAHVISMFDVVVYEDRPWLVMEYLPSRSLAQVLGAEGPLSQQEVADIGRQVADGLAAAHAAGVVHRDVKPGNVLIADDGLVKITDFGVSRAVDDVQLTRTGLIAGTPAFLAPEVARGEDPSAAGDVFALGATLYAAIESIPPFGLDDNAYALLHKVATGNVRPPEHNGPVMNVIMRLLSPAPEGRPTAAQARDLLAATAAGRETGLAPGTIPEVLAVEPRSAAPVPVATPVAPAVGRSRQRRRRNLRTALLFGLLAVLAAGVGVAAAVLNGSGTGNGGTPQAAPPSAVTSVTPPASAPATAPTPSSTASPTPSPTPTTTPGSGTGAVAFVQNYYALLPDNTDAAWPLLGPDAQAASGGRAGFDGFYGSLQSVSLENPRAAGADTVEATVVFVRDDGSTSREPYRFVIGTDADGETIMESFSRA